jgi:hypothetical protein
MERSIDSKILYLYMYSVALPYLCHVHYYPYSNNIGAAKEISPCPSLLQGKRRRTKQRNTELTSMSMYVSVLQMTSIT